MTLIAVQVTLALHCRPEEAADAVNETLRDHLRTFAPQSCLMDYAIGAVTITTHEAEGYQEGVFLQSIQTEKETNMNLLTEAQLDQIATVFGLTPKDTLPVRDGVVGRGDKVWWRNEYHPEHVYAAEHWYNIRNYPDAYQLAKPKTRSIYED